MRYLPALLARVGVSQFEGEYFGRVFADVAESALASLAYFAAVEVFGEEGVVALEMGQFVSVVYVVKVLEAEVVISQTVVDTLVEYFVHQLCFADRVVHQVYLPFQHQEVEQHFVPFHYRCVVVHLYYRLCEVRLNLVVASLAHVVPPHVELLSHLKRYLDALVRKVLVAEPLAGVVAVVHVATHKQETCAQRSSTPLLETLLLVLRLYWSAVEAKDLELILVLLHKEELGVFHVFGLHCKWVVVTRRKHLLWHCGFRGSEDSSRSVDRIKSITGRHNIPYFGPNCLRLLLFSLLLLQLSNSSSLPLVLVDGVLHMIYDLQEGTLHVFFKQQLLLHDLSFELYKIRYVAA